MAGLPIIYYVLDVNYAAPTTVYQIVDNGGIWRMQKMVSFEADTADYIAQFFKGLEAIRPIIVHDSDPRLAHELRQRGLHVK
jgi:hypothetical protein